MSNHAATIAFSSGDVRPAKSTPPGRSAPGWLREGEIFVNRTTGDEMVVENFDANGVDVRHRHPAKGWNSATRHQSWKTFYALWDRTGTRLLRKDGNVARA